MTSDQLIQNQFPTLNIEGVLIIQAILITDSKDPHIELHLATASPVS